jgi:SAM-dependent methyltransferase
MSITERVTSHYGFGSVGATVLDAIEVAGLDTHALQPEDLAPVDEFHTRGRQATEDLAAALGLKAWMHVLDIGAGLGGPARHVTSAVGCRVTGVDLVQEYVDVARVLAQRCDLGARLTFCQGDAVSIPFDDASFDAVMTQHACMNIADKRAVYAEAHRLLRPDSTFGIYDIMQGPGGSPFYPVPWAEDASTSFLTTPREACELLCGAGFDVVSVDDRTDECVQWFDDMRARAGDGARPLGIHLLLGPRFPEIATTLMRNLVERRTIAIQVICRKPDTPNVGAHTS